VVGVLIRMKLRVLRHSLRGGRGVLYGIGVCWGIVAGVVCAGLIGAHPGPVTVGTDIASALFAVWTLGWLCGPILTGGGDETLRPENFALLPIRPVVLARGLLGASLVGAPPLATLLAFSGLVFAALPAGPGAAGIAVLAVGLQLALAVLLSRAVVAGLGALLGTRRGKDLGVILAALVGLLYLPAQALFRTLGPVVVGQTSPMAFYSPSTSFYPCPIRAADVFKPLPTPPPVYYVRDHVRVEYNDSDWATTPEGEEETGTAEGVNESNHVIAAGGASMVVRARRPLGLLSVKMREHREKENIGSNNDEIPKYGQFASPGMPSVPFPLILLTFVAEQSAPAAKADILQGPPSVLKISKVTAESNVKPPACKPLVAANANANASSNSDTTITVMLPLVTYGVRPEVPCTVASIEPTVYTGNRATTAPFAAITAVVGFFFLPETKDVDIKTN